MSLTPVITSSDEAVPQAAASPPRLLHRRRKPKKNNYEPIPVRWKVVLDLHLSGLTQEQIEEQTGYCLASIRRILNDPRVQELRQQMFRYYDLEFEALYKNVVNTVRENLQCDDPKVRNDAAKIWLKAHGKYQPTEQRTVETNISAEKVVFQILNQAKQERRALQNG